MRSAMTRLIMSMLLLTAFASCSPMSMLASTPMVPTHANLNGIAMLSPTDGWIVGSQGVILHYAAGTWQLVASPVSADLWSVSLDSPHDGWAVGSSYFLNGISHGNMLHYTGGSWQAVSNPPTAQYLSGAQMVSPTEGWAVGKDILHYVAGSWVKAPNPDGGALSRRGLSMVSPTEGWAVSSEGFLMRCSSGTWTEWNPPDPTRKLYAISMADSASGWAVGEQYNKTGDPVGSLILRYADGTWVPVPVQSQAFLYGVTAINSGEAWAVGSQGTILHYTAGQWSIVPSLTSATLRGISMLSASEGWAVGDGGTILHFSGGTWTPYGR